MDEQERASRLLMAGVVLAVLVGLGGLLAGRSGRRIMNSLRRLFAEYKRVKRFKESQGALQYRESPEQTYGRHWRRTFRSGRVATTAASKSVAEVAKTSGEPELWPIRLHSSTPFTLSQRLPATLTQPWRGNGIATISTRR